MEAPTPSSVSKSRLQRAFSWWFKIPVQVRVALALFIFIVASLGTIAQSATPDPFRPPRKFFSFAWWGYPLEWNAPARLPKIECDLNAIDPVRHTETIWAVGNKGLVVVSTDGGATWTKRGITANQIVRATPKSTDTPRDAPKRSRDKALLNFPDVVPTTAASSIRLIDRGESRESGSSVALVTQNAALQTPPTSSQDQDDSRVRTSGSAPQTATLSPTSSATPTDETASPIRSTEAVEAPSALIAVHVLDSNTVSVGESRGQSTRTFMTADGGSTWTIREEWLFSQWRDGDWESTDQGLKFSDFGPLYGTYAPFSRNTSWWAVGPSGGVWLITAFKAIRLQRRTSADLYGVYFLDDGQRGWVCGANGSILSTNDGGNSWQLQTSDTISQLNAINFLPDGQQGFTAGNNGIILSTSDGGQTWVHRTQGVDASGMYLRLPAPWYFLVLILIGLMFLPRTKAPLATEESVADVLISDRPLETPAGDVLFFNAIALGLSRFLRNENTLPPLSIAITGEWGTGKSSLMNLLRADLRSYSFRPVWFNAWHHQKEEHMLASLLENIKLQAVPRWWASRGLLFRARLLKIRGWRQWGPLLLLLFFIYVLAVYYAHQHGSDAGFANLFKLLKDSFANPGKTETASHLVTLISLIAGVATFAGAVWRGITAFGVKPASLIAGVSRGVSVRTLEAATSFRQRFAVEFRDVTRALGSRSLLIFIDDLDRCRPENVLETLEAVNFLTTSGECFVVIGMAREYVERCVGRAFKDIAEEMIDDIQPVTGADSNQETSPDQAKEKRIEFARQYLDKLINIEVPVPTVKEAQSLNLLLAGADIETAHISQTAWQKLTGAQSLMRRYWRVPPSVIILAALALGGYYLALSLVPIESPEPSVAQVVPTAQPTPTLAPSPVPTASPGRSLATASPSPTPFPTRDTSNQRAQVTVAGSAVFSRYMLPIMGLLCLVWLGIHVLTQRPEAIVRDSPRFVEALKIWYPIIFSPKHSTPRSTKRFMNRVRYLAMRQRRPREVEPRFFLERIRFAANGRRSLVEYASNPSSIPDEALVALAAMEQFNPATLDENSLQFMESTNSPDWQPLFNAKQVHTKEFGKFDVLQYRDAFLEMAARVEVR